MSDENKIQISSIELFGTEYEIVDESTKQQLEEYIESADSTFQKKDVSYTKRESDSKYLTITGAQGEYQPKGNYVTSNDLTDYAKVSDVQAELDNYPTKQDISSKADKDAVYSKEDADNTFLTSVDVSQQIADELNNLDVKYAHSIPFYDLDEYNKDKDTFSEGQKYILMQDSSTDSINEHPESETYHYSDNQSYLDILFSTIRALQNEITKLKNAFNYGIESYNGKNTCTSTVISEYEEESEPLWAVDEDSLSEITDPNIALALGFNHRLIPAENVTPHNNYLEIKNGVSAAWTTKVGQLLSTINTDNKIFIYLTSDSLDIDISFVDEDNQLGEPLVINLKDLISTNVNPNIEGKFNITLVINRQVMNKLNEQKEGKNFIWISVHDYIADGFEYQGYYNGNGALVENAYYLDKTYIANNISFNGKLSLYKFNIYSRPDNFLGTSNPNIEETPSIESYKYKAAHITVRVIDTYKEAEEIKDQLLEGEPLYIKNRGGLYIIIDGKIKTIGSASNTDPDDQNNQDTDMTQEEIINLLSSYGIINVGDENSSQLTLNNIGDITFINQNTGKKFKFEVNDEGELHSTYLFDNNEFDIKFNGDIDEDGTRHGGVVDKTGFEADSEGNIRGFIGNTLLNAKDPQNRNNTGDAKLNADRLKIGAIYAPKVGQSVYGCSHGYIELENTSNKDINLDGFYIHYAKQNELDEVKQYSLALTGFIPAGGTYLIRCKQYSDFNQANTYIKVKTYDIEWYDGTELLDTSVISGKFHTYLLTFGLPENFSWETKMVSTFTDDSRFVGNRRYHSRYVDSISIGESVHKTVNDNKEYSWEYSGYQKFAIQNEDVIYKNVFELDPAKQAYQGLYTKDSSRIRNDKTTDYQYLILSNDYISFPKSKETYDITKFTPKASFEHKNVCTDKTQLDLEKPNMVTCAFGIDIHKTRCFNWISGGLFDEFVWIRKQGETEWNQFESYHDSIVGQDQSFEPTTSNIYPYRKSFGSFKNKATGKYDSVESIVYDRMTNIFPGCNIKYTAHKCVIEVIEDPVNKKTVYEYVVGRENINHQPDPNHTSDIQTFTLYPTSYTPRLFQTTDQQGFHWIEYQVWAGAAEEINKLINYQVEHEQIIPILINTGDMTQNGTRINEWLDYYNGGKCLFDHLEQMNVVGNNDLCNTDPTILGTGDDPGKSNGYYFHVYYCYEVDTTNLPIISNANTSKYIPSFYYFGNSSYAYIMFNTEITMENCNNWFKQRIHSDNYDIPVNVYTGWTYKVTGVNDKSEMIYDDSFTTIYTMLYNMLDELQNEQHKKCTIACHEMPFTVITNDNLKVANSAQAKNRSLNGSSLVGSHCNLLGEADVKCNYWLSRLLEHFNIKFMLGGHKHTYAITWPIRELYMYQVDGVWKDSYHDGKMVMPQTLEGNNDTAIFEIYYKKEGNNVYFKEVETEGYIKIHSSKFPIMASENIGILITNDNIYYLPYCGMSAESFNGGIMYCMCQATGYKLKSNKELPSKQQQFGYIIPETKHPDSGDKPSNNQLLPMFVEVDYISTEAVMYLRRIDHITKTADTFKDGLPEKEQLFAQNNFSTKPAKFEYLQRKDSDNLYGSWNGHDEDNYTYKAPVLTITF